MAQAPSSPTSPQSPRPFLPAGGTINGHAHAQPIRSFEDEENVELSQLGPAPPLSPITR